MYLKEKQMICDIGHKLWQLGFTPANDGNISIKADEDVFVATPTGISKSLLVPEQIVIVNGKGEKIEKNDLYRPSSEILMHFRCYKERPDISAVIHAHPPTATAFAVAHIPLDSDTMPEAIIFLGSVPIAPYGTPSTEEIPNAVAPLLQKHDAILLENHGALTVGADLTTAYYRMETLEGFAKVTLMARQLGGENELSKEQIDECLALRKAFNVPGRHPGYKKYS